MERAPTDLERGLTAEEVLERAAKGLANGGEEIRTKTIPQILRENILTPFNLLNAALAVLVVAFYEVLCWFLLIPSDPEQARTAWMILGYCLLNALPQWLGMMAVTNLFYFLIRSNVAATFAVLGVIIVPQMVFNLLQAFTFFNAGAYYVFSLLEGWMPQAMVEGAPNVVGDWGYVVQSWILGLAWIAVSTVIGLAAFRKKEIN